MTDKPKPGTHEYSQAYYLAHKEQNDKHNKEYYAAHHDEIR